VVIKGGARRGAGELAHHLQRIDTNERMEVRELRGVLAADLDGALREMAAVAAGSRSNRPLYHASINTRADEIMTPEQKARALDRLEAELGLTGQPRAVVVHSKEGREHVHVVWSRIDGETLKAVSDSHNFRRHEIVARELEREFDHGRVQGVHIERDGVDRPERRPSLAETRQAERSGIDPAEAKAQLRELWESADTGQAFAAALADAGWMLARGDKRGFVALDPTGEARAVNKDITGLTAAQVRARLAEIDTKALPGVDEARALIRARPQPERVPEVESTPQQPQREAHDEKTVSGGMEVADDPQEATQRPSRAVEIDPLQPEPIPVLRVEPATWQDTAAQPLSISSEVWALIQARPERQPEPLPAPAAPDPEPTWVDLATPEPVRVAVPDARDQAAEAERSRLRQVIDTAREKLAELGDRLETAFQRVRNRWSGRAAEPRPEPPPQPQPRERSAADDLLAEAREHARQRQTEDADRLRQLLQRRQDHPGREYEP
jgi:hypothetical protein